MPFSGADFEFYFFAQRFFSWRPTQKMDPTMSFRTICIANKIIYLKADVPTGLVNPRPPAHLDDRVPAAAPLLRFILSV